MIKSNSARHSETRGWKFLLLFVVHSSQPQASAVTTLPQPPSHVKSDCVACRRHDGQDAPARCSREGKKRRRSLCWTMARVPRLHSGQDGGAAGCGCECRSFIVFEQSTRENQPAAKFPIPQWVLVDTEHGNIDDRDMYLQVGAISSSGVSPIVRIAGSEPWMIKRALDCGAHAIMVPMCETPVRSHLLDMLVL